MELRRQDIPDDDEALLAQCDVETFRSSGPGGQNVNRRETAVRIRHRPTGETVVCQDERTQGRNREIALARLRERLIRMTRRRRPRIETRVPKSVVREIVATKRRRGATKALRSRPDREE